jgi:hypothetical protein
METTESYDGAAQGIMALMGIIIIIASVISLICIVSNWKIFSKAGRPGWASIVPIYNIVIFLDIVGKPAWWIILLIIPGPNIVIAIMLVHQLSLAFGQGIGTTLLLLFLPFIGYPMLAFGSATYQRPMPVPQPV